MVESSGSEGISAGRMPAVIYSRVSTVEQDEAKSLADLRMAAERRGFAVVLEVAEQGSGTRDDRPGLQRVLQAVRRGEVRAVLVTRLDRIGRTTLDVIANVRAIADAGGEFVTTEQGLHVRPGGDAMSTAMLSLMAVFAELEHSLIRDRCMQGLARAKRAGVKLGRPRDFSVTASAVKALRAQGASWSEVASRLGCTIGTARNRAAE